MIKDVEGLISHITQRLRSFADVAVVAMSGGADSTLVATLCSLALGPDQVCSLHLPMNDLDKRSFNSRSLRVAKKLKIRRTQSAIDAAVDSLIALICDASNVETISQLNAGNARSRVRMCALYGVAASLGETSTARVRVIGTGNLSEDYIGYDTKGGDALADIFPIGSLFKSEVYQLLDHFVDVGVLEDDLIDRTPSAGLWDGQTDEGELGHTYDVMEQSIRRIATNDGRLPPDASEVDLFVHGRHEAHKHKHLAPPVIEARQFCV